MELKAKRFYRYRVTNFIDILEKLTYFWHQTWAYRSLLSSPPIHVEAQPIIVEKLAILNCCRQKHRKIYFWLNLHLVIVTKYLLWISLSNLFGQRTFLSSLRSLRILPSLDEILGKEESIRTREQLWVKKTLLPHFLLAHLIN